MGIMSTIKGWFSMLLRSRAAEEFNIEPITADQTEVWVNECINIYRGNPLWLDEEDNIDTINFAKAICSETARLIMLGTSIKLDGSARADWLQQQIDQIYAQLRTWVEYGCAYGTIILKPNGDEVEPYTPGQYEITHTANGKITGVVFHNYQKQGKKWYTRLEYHRFEGERYIITNKCFVGESKNDTGKPVDIALTPWDDLSEEVAVLNLKTPLFGVFRTPQANNLDLNAPQGLPIFSEAVQELRDLDIAYSRNSREMKDSKRIVMIDKDRMLPGEINGLGGVKLPDFVALVDGDTSVESDVYHEINPSLNTETRITGINFLLSIIGYKSGYSNGHFVFNQKTGRITAREVESDDARTIQTIKDNRDQLESCINGLVYALNAFADLYGYAPSGTYEIVFGFGDITYNQDEDRARWWGYVQAGKVPAWRYFVKFEGMTEEDAKAMTEEAQPKEPTLFA